MAPGGDRILPPTLPAALGEALRRLGAEIGPVDWLAPGLAVDLPFEALHPDQADAAARQVIGDSAIDVIAQPCADRRKRLLLADMESTLIQNEMLDELADFVGKQAEIADITARAMNGEMDFEEAICARVALLRDLPIATLDAVWGRMRLMPGAATLIATMRGHGAHTVVVSGGFSVFTAKLAALLGVDRHFANELGIKAGCLTGTVIPPILGRQAKFERLVAEASGMGLSLAQTLTVGDGANDLDMILAAGLGIAFHAKPIVAQKAKWRIRHTDLTALLYAQGYHQTEFIVP